MGSEDTSSVRAALAPSALKAALVPRRPVFGNPWDSAGDIFACYVAVSLVDPVLLWAGGELTSAIFGYGSRWPLGVFMAAALVHASGYMKNFGAMSDNPQMAVSWESQYQTLLKSAIVEDARATFQSEGWTSEQPSPVASPPRV